MILAIDTSGRSGSIALVDKGSLVAERTVGDAGPHAGWLLQNIAELCSSKGIAPGEIDLYAAAAGPGSFTGLRIGLTTIKGLAWSMEKPVVPVCTLTALAMNAFGTSMPVCPVLDARKSEVYTGLFSFRDNVVKALMEPVSIRPERLLDDLHKIHPKADPIIFLGNGLGVYGELIQEGRKNTLLAPEPLWHVRASNIAVLAEKKASSCSALSLAPLYLRKSEAEIKKMAAQGG